MYYQKTVKAYLLYKCPNVFNILIRFYSSVFVFLENCPKIKAPSFGYFDSETRYSYYHGQDVIVSCSQGYKLVGESQLQCRNGAWSHEVPTCVYGGGRKDTCENVCNQREHEDDRKCQCHYQCHYHGTCCVDYYYYVSIIT